MHPAKRDKIVLRIGKAHGCLWRNDINHKPRHHSRLMRNMYNTEAALFNHAENPVMAPRNESAAAARKIDPIVPDERGEAVLETGGEDEVPRQAAFAAA